MLAKVRYGFMVAKVRYGFMVAKVRYGFMVAKVRYGHPRGRFLDHTYVVGAHVCSLQSKQSCWNQYHPRMQTPD
jgi:hypothetical protein